MSESEFDSTTTLCGPVPDTFTFAAFDAVAVQGPVLEAPPVALVAPPVLVRPPVGLAPPPATVFPPVAAPPIPVRPPVTLPPAASVPPVLFVLLPPTPAPPLPVSVPPVLVSPAAFLPPVGAAPPVVRAPPVDSAPPDVVGLLVVPPVSACIMPPVGAWFMPPVASAPPVPWEMAPPEAASTLVEPPAPDEPESELPQPATQETKETKVRSDRGCVFILGLGAQSLRTARIGSKKDKFRPTQANFVMGTLVAKCRCGRKIQPQTDEPINARSPAWVCVASVRSYPQEYVVGGPAHTPLEEHSFGHTHQAPFVSSQAAPSAAATYSTGNQDRARSSDLPPF